MLVMSEKGIRLATTSGVIRLTAGVRRNLEGEYLRQALAKGAVPVSPGEPEPEPLAMAGGKFVLERGEGEEPLTEDEQLAADPTVPRADRILAAVRALIERGDESCLTASGVPRVRDVTALVDDEVSRDEVDEAMKRVT